ncbi:MAG: tripartite tricarboxylate transporter permease [Rhodospirillales bacterium]|nr:tripartite tricarboxylate transporter permease [Rhodospirillales bacterium]
MDILSLLTPIYFVLVFVGIVVGIIFGSIPGLTATMAIAVCLPLTYGLNLNMSLALLLGLYVGGISGGLVPAILLKIPGTPSSIATTFDGHPMHQKGEGELALRTGIVASLFGGVFSAAVLFFFAPALADMAIKFSYVEKFLIIFFALTVIASLSKRVLVGLFSGALGVWISLIGTYDTTVGGNGDTRLMFDFMEPYLADGFSLLPVLIGVFGLSTILQEAAQGVKGGGLAGMALSHRTRFSLRVFKGQMVNLIRSSSIGTFVGILPGIGGSAASVLAYTQQKNFSKEPAKMGTGVPEGIIASESSNNGLTGGALIPLLSLGIPGDSTTAVMIAAFTLQGVQVGPLFIGENPQTWDMIIVSLLVANLFMFVVMFFAIKYIIKVIMVPKHILYPGIIVMCVIGAYAINSGIMFDVWTLLLFGLFGYIAEKLGLEIAPFIMGFILGRSAELYFVKSLESFGNLTIFFTKSPIAMLLWVLIALSIGYSFYSVMKTNHQAKGANGG